METNSNSILSSNCCFLFEKCAREAASLGASGHVNSHPFSCWGPLFLKLFSEYLFHENVCQMEPKMPPQIENILTKTTHDFLGDVSPYQ